jgi:hypothetical protein
MGGACSMYGSELEKRTEYRILVGNSEGKRLLGWSRCRLQDNIKMDLREKDVLLWTGFILLGVGTSGGLLWTFIFHKISGNPSLRSVMVFVLKACWTGHMHVIVVHCTASKSYTVLQFTLTLGVDSACNRNEYQESCWGVKGGRRVKLTALLSSVGRIARENVGASMSHNPVGLHCLLQGYLYLLSGNSSVAELLVDSQGLSSMDSSCCSRVLRPVLRLHAWHLPDRRICCCGAPTVFASTDYG